MLLRLRQPPSTHTAISMTSFSRPSTAAARSPPCVVSCDNNALAGNRRKRFLEGLSLGACPALAKHLDMDRKDIQLRLEQTPATELSPDELDAELAQVRAELAALEAAN